ncbi:YdcF family protein [Lacticaseibacillus thailandensis]|nr:YdcF family protein [Lacticaseibacillus thailandensis]
MNWFLFGVFLIAAGCCGLATYSYLSEPRRLVNGLLINLALFSLLTLAAVIVMVANSTTLLVVALIALVIVGVPVIMLVAFHLVWLLWNALLVWRREGHSLGNMLTLMIAAGLVLLSILDTVGHQLLPAWLAYSLTVLVNCCWLYIAITGLNFLTALIAYNCWRTRQPLQYLIVLGAGLLDGHRVSRLLGARIDVAIARYQRQVAQGLPAPTIILSGGQGPDEQVSEAQAMQAYAVAHGIPATATLLEDQSRTTLENMRFSRRIIDQHQQGRPYHAMFCTNNYHLLRAGIFARRAGIDANGIGAKTRLYFLPNATIREYVAMMVMNKRRHFVAGGLILAYTILTMILGATHTIAF